MKKLFNIFKCIFIPFYWLRSLLKNNGNEESIMLSTIYGFFLSIYIVSRFTMGISDANKPNKCKIQNIAEMLVTPMYAIGCNLGKDRFDLKLN